MREILAIKIFVSPDHLFKVKDIETTLDPAYIVLILLVITDPILFMIENQGEYTHSQLQGMLIIKKIIINISRKIQHGNPSH